MDFSFTSELWLHEGPGGWHFVTLPSDVSEAIRTVTEPSRRGFGSVRVGVTIGATRWNTSIFPEATGSYALPVKKQVRAAEHLATGDEVNVRIELLD